MKPAPKFTWPRVLPSIGRSATPDMADDQACHVFAWSALQTDMVRLHAFPSTSRKSSTTSALWNHA